MGEGVRLVVAGAGAFGREHMTALVGRPDVALVGVADGARIITAHREAFNEAEAAARAGAQEILQKPIHGYTLLTTVRSVFEKASRQRKLRALRQTLQVRFEALSPREREVMQLAVRGLSNPEISKRIKIGQRTVESYRLSMMGKMQAASIVELVLQAHALGEVPDWTARE